MYGPIARRSANAWRRTNAERSLRADHNKHLKKKYGLTIEQYEEMVAVRGNKCDICGRTPIEVGDSRRLSVDHCHKTGRIRGLLCRWCNTAIGQLQDSVQVMENAIKYMKEWQSG
ncbi:endonuclease VII domain-containing protein [Segniliparus rugosus]|uniref:endonuclease VII domain-containing protein n=1 Tax=Segniliparus rugosus TaxID=286804 RepID=UPI0009FDDD12